MTPELQSLNDRICILIGRVKENGENLQRELDGLKNANKAFVAATNIKNDVPLGSKGKNALSSLKRRNRGITNE